MKKKETLKFLVGVGIFVILYGVHSFLVARGVVVENRGVGLGWAKGLAGFLAGGIWVLMLFWEKKTGFLGIKIILLAGAINLTDRLIWGAVRDYWYLGKGVYNNVADWLLAVGLVIFLVELWKTK